MKNSRDKFVEKYGEKKLDEIIGKVFKAIKIEDSHKSVLCHLPIAGCSDDGTLPVYTGCIDGNGRAVTAQINKVYIKKLGVKNLR